MLNKKDPLIDSVKRVMEQNAKERSAAHMVNEKFGITDRRALPHERQHEWDAAYKSILSESASLAKLAPPHDKVTHKDVLVGRGVLVKKGDKHVVAEEEIEEQQAPKTDPYAEGQASSISTVAPKEKSVTPADQSALKKKIQGIVKESVMRKLEERKVNPYAVGTAQAMKSTGDKPPLEKSTINKAHKIAKAIQKVNEGFNNRHSLSVTASAEKQTVADLNEAGGPVPVVVKRQQAAASNKKMTNRIKAREPREPSSFERFQAREKEKPTPVLGGAPVAPGPIGAIKSVVGAGIRAGMNYFGRTQQSVPQVQGQGGSSGRMPPSGAWGNIRNARPNDAARISAGRDPARSAATRDTFQGKLAQARQSTPNAAGANAARLARADSRQSTPNAASANASRIASQRRGPNAAGANAARLARAQGNKSPIDTPKGKIGAPSSAAADTGPEKIKTSTQTTTTKQDYDKMSFSQAFKSARQQAGGASGKFTYKGKEYQTNIKGSGTAQKPQEKYQPSSKLKTVTPPSVTKTSTSVVGGQGIAAIPGGASGVKSASPTPSSPMASQGSSGSTQSKILPQRIQPTSAPAPVSQSMSANAAEGGLKPRSGQQGMNDTQRRDSNYNSGVRGK